MKIRLLKTARIKEMLDAIGDNLQIYREGNFSFLEIDRTAYFELDYEIDENKLALLDCSKDNHNEIKNCRNVFDSMNNLSLYHARDERIWVYLTHTILLDYTRKRWPIPEDDDKAIKFIRNHFFVIGARGFERDNSASRLWWMASLCNRVNGLSLEEALTSLLYQYDVRANIIERPTTSQSIHIFSTLIIKLYASYNGDRKLFERSTFREAMRKLNLLGGVKLLDSMSERDIETLVDKCFA